MVARGHQEGLLAGSRGQTHPRGHWPCPPWVIYTGCGCQWPLHVPVATVERSLSTSWVVPRSFPLSGGASGHPPGVAVATGRVRVPSEIPLWTPAGPPVSPRPPGQHCPLSPLGATLIFRDPQSPQGTAGAMGGHWGRGGGQEGTWDDMRGHWGGGGGDTGDTVPGATSAQGPSAIDPSAAQGPPSNAPSSHQCPPSILSHSPCSPSNPFAILPSAPTPTLQLSQSLLSAPCPSPVLLPSTPSPSSVLSVTSSDPSNPLCLPSAP